LRADLPDKDIFICLLEKFVSVRVIRRMLRQHPGDIFHTSFDVLPRSHFSSSPSLSASDLFSSSLSFAFSSIFSNAHLPFLYISLFSPDDHFGEPSSTTSFGRLIAMYCCNYQMPIEFRIYSM
jgi:hypothetical protein